MANGNGKKKKVVKETRKGIGVIRTYSDGSRRAFIAPTAGQVQKPKLKLKKAKYAAKIAKKPYVRKSIPLGATPKIRRP